MTEDDPQAVAAEAPAADAAAESPTPGADAATEAPGADAAPEPTPPSVELTNAMRAIASMSEAPAIPDRATDDDLANAWIESGGTFDNVQTAIAFARRFGL